MTNQATRDLVFTSMIFTLIIVLSLIPNLGFIEIGPISFTIVHIPVIIATIFLNKKMGMIAGALFGFFSMYLAYTRALEHPATINYLFRDPSIALVPRVLFPLLTGLLYENLKNFIKRDSLNILISTIAASIFHSSLVYMTLVFFFFNVTYLENASIVSINENIFTENIVIFFGTAFIGSIIKAVIVGFIATPIIIALKAKFQYNDYEEELN